jgi:hypothetical protein
MDRLRRLLPAAVVLVLTGALVLALVGPAAAADVSRRSAVRTNGAVSSLNLLQSGDNALDVWAGLQFPDGVRGQCAYAILYVPGRYPIRGATLCDGNRDGNLRWAFGDYNTRRTDTLTVWFSDRYTDYGEAHPAVIIV